MSKNKIFTEDDILDLIRSLSYSQGFYGRLLVNLLDAKENDPEAYDDFIKSVQDAGVSSDLDLIYFLEC